MSAPRPARDRAVLASEGYPGVRFTTHHFVGAVPVRLSDGRGGFEAYWSFQFQCFETGAVRRFGLADRTTLTPEEIAEEGN